MQKNINPFSINRTEEIGFDVWTEFVIPPFYNKLDLRHAKKPRLIIGGRGCGKTMLLRYLSHQSTFSPSRSIITNDDLKHIGLYWRVDTQFASTMTKRNVAEDIWQAAFEHMTSLLVGLETLKSIESLSNSKFDQLEINSLNSLDFSELQFFNKDIPSNFQNLKSYLRNKLWEFQTWLNNVRRVDPPIFLPKKFVEALIIQLKANFSFLSETIFYVYLDEYENLLPEQQRIINTWLKHSEAPLIFNLAMKRNSFKEKRTIGDEFLSDIHDYRQYDLEDYYDEENSFEAFAAEILLTRLKKLDLINIPFSVTDLQDINQLDFRNTIDYKKKVIGFAQNILPGFSRVEIAKEVFNDKILHKRLQSQIKEGLAFRNSRIALDRLCTAEAPEASIIVPSLLYRSRIQPKHIADEIEKLIKKEDNKFTGKADWLHNYFTGCILLLYEPLPRTCPIYCGFKTFCLMAHGNIRHFLELCNKAIPFSESSTYINITQKNQYEAAKQVSIALLDEIRTFGRYGNQLHAFVLRLGSLFRSAQKRPSQSEPELTHFSIVSGSSDITSFSQDLIIEATKWSVLFEEKSTKKKSLQKSDSLDYVLNPIYAPYFNISYRKGRKLELSVLEFTSLLEGSIDEYEKLLKSFIRKWDVKIDDNPGSLFANLNLAE